MGRVDAQIPKGVCALAVMTKAPRAGEVKTRLSPPLTLKEAAALSACFLRDTAAAIAAIAVKSAARGVAVYTPRVQKTLSEVLLRGFCRAAAREALATRTDTREGRSFPLGVS